MITCYSISKKIEFKNNFLILFKIDLYSFAIKYFIEGIKMLTKIEKLSISIAILNETVSQIFSELNKNNNICILKIKST